ncbi:5-oxoprolinase subunit PxpB [Staphylococcus pseudintermedius]|uniref:5-oxoprolinase subunit PxpB n=2 Tax=Staphylococcus pseudintermedius TaxID=283734 RepID=UPI001036D1D0|nr:5-oxoprolinase subunit PxpB [Staphylococcus pseudintermedius]EGQ0315291.1 5-oxoprolinase subunit PxpB [Staphylococcus pseudintermedius]EGQ0320110.1 5-oxoprolinase subunit PxpB [Staphylococcus pseudintermedius]EGQ0323148.1 5-oxoprolinase subunit PxpB [Staphylococcus pseudintermedius]EGQ0373348.1 5-oxoprolinase subunit PxpB [Staphylococcus pseudintermedius]EGQ0380519.1 5-oxoprolinase subunit PxpB [Staphylococcus pseudintermedius]
MYFRQISEQSFIIYFKAEISESVYEHVNAVVEHIQKMNHPHIHEIVPSYRAIMVYFDGIQTDFETLIQALQLDTLDMQQTKVNTVQKRIVNIPVLYGGKWGPDIEIVADHNHLTVDEVIQYHTENHYLVYMIGFMPGFPFLGGLSPRLHTPRKEEPRIKIDAGSVGIANNQTGLYPSDSPGGWQIIGRTPIDVFNPKREPKILYQPGDRIKFYSINEEQFLHIQKYVRKNQLDYDEWVMIEDGH